MSIPSNFHRICCIYQDQRGRNYHDRYLYCMICICYQMLKTKAMSNLYSNQMSNRSSCSSRSIPRRALILSYGKYRMDMNLCSPCRLRTDRHCIQCILSKNKLSISYRIRLNKARIILHFLNS